MLSKVEIYSDSGRELILPLGDSSSGFIVKDIEGLDPVKATMVSSKFAQIDGTEYQSSSRESRNIVIKLGLAPDEVGQPISVLRNFLYARLMPKSDVMLRFFLEGDEEGFVQIEGRVETCQSPLFSADPEMIVSIMCFKPDFLATKFKSQGEYSFDTTSEEFSVYSYPGSIETGIDFTLMVDRTISEFAIYNYAANFQTYTLDFVAPMLAGDQVRISTVAGNKFATLTRDNTESSMLYGISPAANWISLYPGDNEIRVVVEGDPMFYNLTYQARYGGL